MESRTNGCVQRIHRTLNDTIGKVVETHQTNWPEYVPFFVNAYNITIHASTGYSTFLLMFGWDQRVPLDIVLGSPSSDRNGVSQYAKILLNDMHQAHVLVCKRLQRFGQIMKQYYEKSMKKVFNPANGSGFKIWGLTRDGAPNGNAGTKGPIWFWKS